MNNNDILRRLRYTFDYKDTEMAAIFESAEHEVKMEEIFSWLRKNDDPKFKECRDYDMAAFLNGFINIKRGKKDGPAPVPEKKLNNNIIFRKLRIALDLKAEDVIEILKTADYSISKNELSAFFRKPDHKHYRECQDQILRNFLMGVQLKYHKKK